MLKLPPPLWALIYVLVAAGGSYLLGSSRASSWPSTIVGAVLIVIGLALAVPAARLFRREGTELNPTSETNSKLVTSGPFRFTRNPMYLGLVVVTLGIAIWVGTWPMFLAVVATFATANWGHIPFEEAKMRRQFGEEFDSYCRHVRRWI